MNVAEYLTGDEEKAIAEIKERVIALIGERLKGYYLFGSRARGDYDNESGVDLAIIVEGLDRTMKRSIIDMVTEVEVKYFVVISSLVLSQGEFDLLRKRERRIALDIEKEGIKL